LDAEDPLPVILIVSAESHLPAISKDDLRAGGIFEEQVDDRTTPQCRQFLDRPALERRASAQAVSKNSAISSIDFQVLDGEKMLLHEICTSSLVIDF
jgi:hypothetical protein